jgi:tetratricopeptide (TPR) repeat protein
MKLNDFETCSNLAEKAYARYPEPEFLVPSLYILLMQDQWDKASRLVKSALLKNPSTNWLLMFEAATTVQGYIRLNQSTIRDRSTAVVHAKSAVIAYETAVQRWGQDKFSVVYPKSMARDLYRIAAVSANRANQFQEALNFAEKSLTLGWSYLGCKTKAIQFLNLGRVQDALKFIEAAIIKHPSNKKLKAFQKRTVEVIQTQKQLIGQGAHVPGSKTVPLVLIVVDEN